MESLLISDAELMPRCGGGKGVSGSYLEPNGHNDSLGYWWRPRKLKTRFDSACVYMIFLNLTALVRPFFSET